MDVKLTQASKYRITYLVPFSNHHTWLLNPDFDSVEGLNAFFNLLMLKCEMYISLNVKTKRTINILKYNKSMPFMSWSHWKLSALKKKKKVQHW